MLGFWPSERNKSPSDDDSMTPVPFLSNSPKASLYSCCLSSADVGIILLRGWVCVCVFYLRKRRRHALYYSRWLLTGTHARASQIKSVKMTEQWPLCYTLRDQNGELQFLNWLVIVWFAYRVYMSLKWYRYESQLVEQLVVGSRQVMHINHRTLLPVSEQVK